MNNHKLKPIKLNTNHVVQRDTKWHANGRLHNRAKILKANDLSLSMSIHNNPSATSWHMMVVEIYARCGSSSNFCFVY